MNEHNKILVVEDELTNSILLKRSLSKIGFSVDQANNGYEALLLSTKNNYDAILTDWMMPQMDGIELVKKIREKISPVPYIIIITALVSEGAKNHALELGADDYIAKPIVIDEVIQRLKDGLARKYQDVQIEITNEDIIQSEPEIILPPIIAVGIATSTGGPPTLIEIFKKMNKPAFASFFIVQHGPAWMLETFSERLQKETNMKVIIPQNNEEIKPSTVYIAPGDFHMRILPGTFSIIIDKEPKENFVRPSADPLFRSISDAFKEYCIGIILTGLGKDGAKGASQLAKSGGKILVQNPAFAVAQSMPKTITDSTIPHLVLDTFDIAEKTEFYIQNLLLKLNRKKKS